jgi:hypothetical protein
MLTYGRERSTRFKASGGAGEAGHAGVRTAGVNSAATEINVQDASLSKLTKKFSAGNAKKLLDAPLDRIELAKARLPYEALDQLTMEILMGVA